MSNVFTIAPGVYGKLPSHGDFLSRRLPRSFVSPWDLWLQEALERSREILGADWLRHYLVGPVWRFALTSGIAGQHAWTGLLMPSVDQAERYFPFTLACRIPEEALPWSLITDASNWFAGAEALMLSWLDQDADIETVERDCIDLGAPPILTANSPLQDGGGVGDAWRIPLSPREVTTPYVCQALLHKSLSDQFFAYSLWWFEEAQVVTPSLLVCQGLPPPDGFSAMLDGKWQRAQWQEIHGLGATTRFRPVDQDPPYV
jgi:type VI secretion system protein ImpM